jgi:D-alanyl-D-alanine carboxypeptidase (penicillin-binding protein 5/6)
VNKLLKIQVITLLCLVALSIFVRLGVINGTASSGPSLQQPSQNQATEPPATQPPATEPPATQPPATEPPPTEPPIQLTFGEDFSLESREYFLYHMSSDEVLFSSGDLEKRVYPASVTKLFSSYVALQYLRADTVVTVGQEVNLVGSGSSLAYIQKGERITVERLVEGMLIPSGNDAAYALAVAAARAESGDPDMGISDALKHFAQLMNLEAAKNGMTGSHFTNPDGYHDMDHYTCLRDLITIAKLSLKNEVIMRYTGIYSDRVGHSTGDTSVWTNTNALVNAQSQYYCENALGLKTGHTAYAGFCLLSAFEVDGEQIIIGSFACVRPEDRFIDTLKIYEVYLNAVKE